MGELPAPLPSLPPDTRASHAGTTNGGGGGGAAAAPALATTAASEAAPPPPAPGSAATVTGSCRMTRPSAVRMEKLETRTVDADVETDADAGTEAKTRTAAEGTPDLAYAYAGTATGG